MIPLRYRDHTLSTGYRPDFVCGGRIVVEVKALPALLPEHRAQIINYLDAGPFPVGLLTNFGHYPKLEFERFVLTPSLQRNRKGNTGYGK